MTAIVACSITVLAMIGQELEAQKGRMELELVGLTAMSGALQPGDVVLSEASWFVQTTAQVREVIAL